MAQLAEQLICNQQVIGSSPIIGFKAHWLSWLERRPVTAEVKGSSPLWVVSFIGIYGVLAQLGEHLPYKQGVTGSSPVSPISFYSKYGPVVKRLRHRPFTAVTRVRFPSGSVIQIK